MNQKRAMPLLFVFLVVASFFVARYFTANANTVHNLLIGDLMHVDLGIRVGGLPGEEFVRDVSVQNLSGRSVQILSSKVSCTCTDATASELPPFYVPIAVRETCWFWSCPAGSALA